MTAICIIPARGGSKRLPGKNIKMFHGKPIIAYPIEAAKQSGVFNRVIVSSDSWDVLDLAREYGADVHLREQVPDDIDEVGLYKELVSFWKPNYFCGIYPCAPLITPMDLKQAHGWMELTKCPAVMGCNEEGKDNGSFYFYETKAFLEQGQFPEKLQWHKSFNVDINTQEDFDLAHKIYGERK